MDCEITQETKSIVFRVLNRTSFTALFLIVMLEFTNHANSTNNLIVCCINGQKSDIKTHPRCNI